MYKFILASICAMTMMTSAYAAEKVQLDGDVHVGTYGSAKNLTVTKDVNLQVSSYGEKGLKIGDGPTSGSSYTASKVRIFMGAEGGQSATDITPGAVEVAESVTVGSSKTKVSSKGLDLTSSYYGKSNSTNISYAGITVSGNVTLVDQKLLDLVLQREALINDLKQRVAALEAAPVQ